MTDSDVNAGTDRDQDGYGGYGSAADPEPVRRSQRRLPLTAAVLLADAGVAFVAFVLLIVISVQRYGENGSSGATGPYVEALVVIFVVTALFAAGATFLLRTGQSKAGAVQIAVAAIVLVLGLVAAIGGRPGSAPAITPVDQITDDGPPIPQAPSTTNSF